MDPVVMDVTFVKGGSYGWAARWLDKGLTAYGETQQAALTRLEELVRIARSRNPDLFSAAERKEDRRTRGGSAPS